MPSPHLMVLATNEQFLPAWGTFRAILDNESHWLQPVMVLSFHWWSALAGVGRVLDEYLIHFDMKILHLVKWSYGSPNFVAN